VHRARGYGVEGHSVDGTDLLACVATFRTAFARARAGNGPQLVVGKLLRLGGHGEHDDASYIPDSARHQHEARDCIEVAKAQAIELGWATDADFLTWEEEARRDVDAAQAIASKEPTPDPYRETWHALSTSALVEGQHG